MFYVYKKKKIGEDYLRIISVLPDEEEDFTVPVCIYMYLYVYKGRYILINIYREKRTDFIFLL